jgi:ubiquitin-protein ligase E3 C
MLVELPLASFFLSKLLGQKSVNVDIDHLQSLDPELYKNLLYLKNYDGDVIDLGLDFTIVSEEIGKAHVEEMKPGGANIAVNNENRIEYIHLVADFKLNRQIRSQCAAFRYVLHQRFINLDDINI